MNRQIRLDVDGMSCDNCKVRIETALRKTKGVIKASADYQKGLAEVIYDENKTNPDKISHVINGLGYKVIKPEEKTGSFLTKVGALLMILLLFFMLNHFGILNKLVPGQLADTGMGYGMLFVIGLFTSVHCIAMCGGIGLSQSLQDKAGGKFTSSALIYNLGRVLSYTVIGLVLGSIGMVIGEGSKVGIPLNLQGILKILAGVFMVIMGLNLLGIFPGLKKIRIKMPLFVAKMIGKSRSKAAGPFIVGILNGFMPCGPLQAMWIVALAAGNPISGALSMMFFGLGTMPLMLGLGSIVSALGRKYTASVMKVGAILVAVLGLSMLTQGINLAGTVGVNESATVNEVIDEVPEIEDSKGEEEEVQVINSTLRIGRYPDIEVKAGIPVKWIIDAPKGSINGCNAMMVINEYGIQYVFNEGENVIEFTPDKPGTYTYTCWMGMITADITVTEGE